MNMELTDDEQVEKLKKWWKENGAAVIVGVIVGISVVVGVWKYREYTETQALQASDVYVEFNDALAEKKDELINQHYDVLKNEYSGTSYAMLAAMHMAKLAVENENYGTAEQHLKWALETSGHESLTHVARIRLAELLVSQEKYEQALLLIQNVSARAFDPQYQEIRGDIYTHQGKIDEARTAYNTALESSSIIGKRREFLQMKLSNLESPAASEASEQVSDK